MLLSLIAMLAKYPFVFISYNNCCLNVFYKRYSYYIFTYSTSYNKHIVLYDNTFRIVCSAYRCCALLNAILSPWYFPHVESLVTELYLNPFVSYVCWLNRFCCVYMYASSCVSFFLCVCISFTETRYRKACIYINVCSSMYPYMYKYVCVYICICTYVCVHVYLLVYVYILCECMYVCMYMYISVYICTCICVCVCAYICIYVFSLCSN